MANQASSAAEPQSLSLAAAMFGILIPEAARILLSQETTRAINERTQDPDGDQSPEMIRALEQLEEFLHNAPPTGDLLIPAEAQPAVLAVVSEGCVSESLRAIDHEAAGGAATRSKQRQQIAAAEFWLKLADELEPDTGPRPLNGEEISALEAEVVSEIAEATKEGIVRLPSRSKWREQLIRFGTVLSGRPPRLSANRSGGGERAALEALRDGAAIASAELDEWSPWGLASRVIRREVEIYMEQHLDGAQASSELLAPEAQVHRDVIAVLDRHLPRLDLDSEWGQLWRELRDSLEEEEEGLEVLPEADAARRISTFLRDIASRMPYTSQLRDLALRSSSRWGRVQ